ncbi:hypothetical protein TIFTF001_003103 [Ficus carica]|uniref:Uncharacterized protein n=1 Tax=Ficus carica TaxID=3494 RepID=A0AA87ZG06_FICCA|nr:hypothetical protein TIFTF001_003103 [Ficus carica]
MKRLQLLELTSLWTSPHLRVIKASLSRLHPLDNGVLKMVIWGDIYRWLEKLGDDLGRSKGIEWGSVQTLRALEVPGWIEYELGRDADDVSKDELLGES